MKSKIKSLLLILVVFALIFACNQVNNNSKNETILKGETSILVDETLVPIIEDQIEVFESKYPAKINLIAKSEIELMNELQKGSIGFAVLSRKLTAKEESVFEKRKIKPRTTPFAIDAIALIRNNSNKDTIISLQEVIDFMKGKRNTNIKGLVFDNPNSSTVRYMNNLAGLNAIPENGIFSFKTNQEVIKFVSENDGMIGVIGVNWLSQPEPTMVKFIEKISILEVKGLNKNEYVAPTQNNIAEGRYPLARDLFIVNCQGFSGLGMGFSSFVAGDIGQRIILKSGLLPIQVPGRNIIIRNEIENNKK
ncbi:MAG: substrate-binding domain-containing protein [Bacteroidota bacterium]